MRSIIKGTWMSARANTPRPPPAGRTWTRPSSQEMPAERSQALRRVTWADICPALVLSHWAACPPCPALSLVHKVCSAEVVRTLSF